MEQSTCAFNVTMKDVGTDHEYNFVLSFYERDKSISLYDVKNKRMFLKRNVPTEGIEMGALYIGANITVFSRSLKIVDFADEKTKRLFTTSRGAGLLLIKPDSYRNIGQILDIIYHTPGLSVGRLRMVKFTSDNHHNSSSSISHHDSAQSFIALGSSSTTPSSLVGDNCLAVEIVGEDIIARLHELVGPADPNDAKQAAPASLRAIFGKSKDKNAIHVSSDIGSAKAELAFLFDRSYPYTSVFTHCSVCIIRPHAVASKFAGNILDHILSTGLEVSGLRSISITTEDAADFFESYRTVVSEYERWVKELSSGPCIVMEVRGDHNIVQTVRELAGPYDPIIAKQLYPESLRAKYGIDNVRNALLWTMYCNGSSWRS